MLDFLIIRKVIKKNGIEIVPVFKVAPSKHLMIRGGDFYAIWDETLGLWSTDEFRAIDLIDHELDMFATEEIKGADVFVQHLWDADSGMIDKWHRYTQRQMKDSYVELDPKLYFQNDEIGIKDYASKKLPYPLIQGPTDAWDELVGTLYSEAERHKIEWAIGSIVCGDSRKLEKFLVMYGPPGAGKGTILKIIKKLFDEYCAIFDAESLGSSSNQFALEAFKSNPIVAIQYDGDLSRIERNARLNSLISHEAMTVNEKYKSSYTSSFHSFLFMGTNKPVKITDAQSGLLRRLIDVYPSGHKIEKTRYFELLDRINFELGAIAYKCRDVYWANPNYYDSYAPINMLGSTNDFYNFVLDCYDMFVEEDGTTLKTAWGRYSLYKEEANLQYPMTLRIFKEELKNYFDTYSERPLEFGGEWHTYKGFKTEKFINPIPDVPEKQEESSDCDWLSFSEQASKFDEVFAEAPAQYATEKGTPQKAWINVDTTLSKLDTHKLHYAKLPENVINIDFDIPDPVTGEKSYELNMKKASKWPKTYAELSKSGGGIHLTYFYSGDPSELAGLVEEHVEIKVSKGGSALRRRLTKCNSEDVATIHPSAMLPKKEVKPVLAATSITTEKGIRKLIIRNLLKEIHPNTVCSVNFIQKILDDAYSSGMSYDVSDMRADILAFASGSTHNANECIKKCLEMHFASENPSEYVESSEEDPITFWDVEVYPNLFVLCYMLDDRPETMTKLINPSPAVVREFCERKLVGFNNRKYDNHITYARALGEDNAKLYQRSQAIINKTGDGFIREAYNLSYTDIYDFASAGNKKSLKKFEIEMRIHHMEMGFAWDEPVPEEHWNDVAEYCANDVIATWKTFHYIEGDWKARLILAELAGMTPNNTTNQLTTRIIFGDNKAPQGDFNYRNMGVCDGPMIMPDKAVELGCDAEYTVFDTQGRPIFPGYEYKFGKSSYRGENIGEGGYVYSVPGAYEDVWTFDVTSQHPSTIIAENLFGPYTQKYKELLDIRVLIKHKDYEAVKKLWGGKLAPYMDDPKQAKVLSNALKTAINSVYGLTSAGFENPFRDPRNVDNIVAKRGELFMINLKHEVEARGYNVVHIKTDSIKIERPDEYIESFIYSYGRMYGYGFEIEHKFEKLCLVNKAVYIGKLSQNDPDYSETPNGWTATGAQFAHPYVFKTLFSHEDIEFDDLCETKNVTGALYLDCNEGLPDVLVQEKELERMITKYCGSKKQYDRATFLTTSDEPIASVRTRLQEEISAGHNYVFVGKIGLFCPVVDGCGGGYLVRKSDLGYSSVGGTKGYKWMESELVLQNELQDKIDIRYFDDLVEEAKTAIGQYCDVEQFVS